VDPKSPLPPFDHLCPHPEFVVIAGWSQKPGAHVDERGDAMKATAQLALAEAVRAEPALVGAIEPIEVIGVKYDSGFVTITPLDRKSCLKHPNRSVRWASRSRSVAQRPTLRYRERITQREKYIAQGEIIFTRCKSEEGEAHAAESHRCAGWRPSRF